MKKQHINQNSKQQAGLPRFLGLMMLFALFVYACDPSELDKPELGNVPSADEISIAVAPGKDKFRFAISASSPVPGIAKWNYGNGSTGSNQDTAYYPVAGTYTITLTLYTRGGSVSKTQQITTTDTDWPFFDREDIVALSGGSEALSGKTWVLDSLSSGHLGVGPAGSDGLGYWSAAALAKKGDQMYDDQINFTLNGFTSTFTNHGKSYVKVFRANDPSYTNPVSADGDMIVDYTPQPGKWAIQEKGADKYLVLTGSTPMFPCFDVGAVDGSYKILSLQSNKLELVATGGDGNAWHFQLIPMGYVKPMLTYNLSITAGAGTNEYNYALTNVNLPAGITITGIRWKFGDGAETTETDINKTLLHTYMRKNQYNVEVEVTTSADAVSKSTIVSVAQNHPSYVPYLLDQMVMYQDFGETNLVPMAFDNSDGSGSIVTVANPDASRYPNLSSKVGKYTKIDAQYANTYLKLPTGYRYNLTKQTVFKLLVFGKAGDEVLLKLENTDKGGNAWQTGAELRYTIKKDNTWEEAMYNFSGVGAGFDWTGDIYTTNIATDTRFNSDFYNIVRIMYKPGDKGATYSFHFDDLAGPHIEGL